VSESRGTADHANNHALDQPKRIGSLTFAILIGAAGSLLASAYLASVAVGVILTALLVAIGVIASVLPRVRLAVFGWMRRMMNDESLSALRQPVVADTLRTVELDTGIRTIYRNFSDARTAILDHMSQSRRVDIFVQIGTTVGVQEPFLDALTSLPQMREDVNVRVLKAGLDSPYLSELRAMTRGKDYQVWRDDIRAGDNHLANLQETADENQWFQYRHHREGYLWRFFIFDDHAFLQPYYRQSDNAQHAPVYELAMSTTSNGQTTALDFSLARVLEAYFDQKWDEYRPTTIHWEEEARTADSIAVVAVLELGRSQRRNTPRRYVLVVASSKLSNPDGPPPFYYFGFPGGQVSPDESVVAALHRELQEELGVTEQDYEILSAKDTHFFTGGTYEGKSTIEGLDPKPMLLFNRTKGSSRQIILAFKGRLKDDVRALPSSEQGLSIVMTEGTMVDSLRNKITIALLQKSPPNQVFNRKHQQFFPDVVLRPQDVTSAVISLLDNRVDSRNR